MKKKKQTSKPLIRDVICTVSKVEGCILPGFEVQEWKTDFAKVEGPNVDFFLIESKCYPQQSMAQKSLARAKESGEKVHFRSLNFHESLIFIREL